MPSLFTYGTIRDPKIQKEIIGRTVKLTTDSLSGFTLSEIELNGRIYPIIVLDNQSEVNLNGAVFPLSQTELEAFDEYEGSAYKRSLVKLESGLKAWVYHQ